jgi:hypothetical protein
LRVESLENVGLIETLVSELEDPTWADGVRLLIVSTPRAVEGEMYFAC